MEEVCFYFSNLSHFKLLSCTASILETPQEGLLVLFKLNLLEPGILFICTTRSAKHCRLFSEAEYLDFLVILLSTEEFN